MIMFDDECSSCDNPCCHKDGNPKTLFYFFIALTSIILFITLIKYYPLYSTIPPIPISIKLDNLIISQFIPNGTKISLTIDSTTYEIIIN